MTFAPVAAAEPEEDDFGFTPVAMDLGAFEAPAGLPDLPDLPPLPDLAALAPLPDLSAPSASQGWRVVFRPHPRLYASANETGLLLRELGRLGPTRVQMDDSGLPLLDALEPTDSHLIWTIELDADVSEAEVREVFDFVEMDCDLSVTPLGDAAPVEAAPAAVADEDDSDASALARAAAPRLGVQAVTVFGGFPISDLAETGLSIVTVADTPALATAVSAKLGREAWRRRANYVYHEEPLPRSIARASGLAGGGRPVLLLDHGDNCMSGGSCDVMDVLEELLKAGETGIMVGPICDPETVAQLVAAGEQTEVEIALGNKTPAKGMPAPHPPLRLRGRVTALSDGRYRVAGPIYHGQELSMGRAAAFDTGTTRIVICEEPHEPLDLGCFASVGLDPTRARFLHLKSRMYCRPVFEPLAAAAVECASAGVTASDFGLFAFQKLARPIYPLDPETVWEG